MDANFTHARSCALIDHAVKEEGKATIAKWICDIINAAPDTETAAKELAALASSWVEHFFLPLLTLTSAPSECQAPIPGTGDQNMLSVLLHRREGEHCIISSSPNIRNIAYRSSPETPAILEVAHILPHFLNKLNDENAENKGNVAITRDMLKTWTSMDMQQWVGRDFDNPRNAILVTG